MNFSGSGLRGVAEALTAAISGLVVLAVAGFTEGQLRGIARATLRLLD